MAVLSEYILRDDRASQPAAADAGAGALYCVTDEDFIIERSTGSAWEQFSPDAPTTFPTIWTSVFKTANETKTSDTTTANDSALVVALTANKLYTVRLRVFFTSHSTPDFKYQMNFSGTVNRVTMYRQQLQPNSATPAYGIGEAFDSGDVTVACVTGQDGWLYAEFSIDVANGGNFQFQWAQNGSSVENTTVYAGSSIEYKLLN